MNTTLPYENLCGLILSGSCLAVTPTPTTTPLTYCFVSGLTYSYQPFECPFDGTIDYDVYGQLRITAAIYGTITSTHPPITAFITNGIENVSLTIPENTTYAEYVYLKSNFEFSGGTCQNTIYPDWYIVTGTTEACLFFTPTPTPTLTQTPTQTATQTQTPTGTPTPTPTVDCSFSGSANYVDCSFEGAAVYIPPTPTPTPTNTPSSATPTPTSTQTPTPTCNTNSRILLGIDDLIYYSDNNAISYSATNFSYSGLTQVQEIAYGNNVWVAVSDDNGNPANGQLAYSTNNGIDWTFPISNTNTHARDVYFFGGFWLAGIGTSAYTSTNGTSWSYLSTTGSNIRTFGYNGSRIVVAGGGLFNASQTIQYSDNSGTTWSNATRVDFSGITRDVWYNGSRWVAGGISKPYTLAYSNDGASWTGISNIISTEVTNVTWDGSRWLAVGSGSGFTLAQSTNGISWTGITQTAFTSPETIIFNGTYYVVSNQSGAKSWYSTNATTWTASLNSSGGTYNRALASFPEPYHIPPLINCATK
jgi:hypothetical protein